MAEHWLDFETEKIAMRPEVRRLEAVLDAGAAEAAIFYAGRITEATAWEAVRRCGGHPSTNLYANLVELTALNVLPDRVAFWGHMLRRLGNEVRHVLRAVRDADADAAVVFLARWLAWFFSGRFPVGEVAGGVPELASLAARRASDLAELTAAIESGGGDLDSVIASFLAAHEGSVDIAPAIAAVLADMIIQAGRPGDALPVLGPALEKTPMDVRLRQLKGLAYSRLGELETAAAIMEELMNDRPEDPETAGILGGIYKRQWDRAREAGEDRADLLRLAFRTYNAGWKQHRRANTYLGINAATLALLDSREDQAADIAGRVRAQLRERDARIKALPKIASVAPVDGLAFWDQLTLAEADLIFGDTEAARASYNAAAERYPDRAGDLKVALGQARLIAARKRLALDFTVAA
jgi:tetratricopeptide (TPR) repeat protein